MRVIIDASKAILGSSLQLRIFGFSIEVSDISSTGKVVIVEDSGKISIDVLPLSEDIEVSEPLLENVQEVKQVEPIIEYVPEALDISRDLLFKRLVALRRQIASEVRLPPYIIFHDTSLKDMVSKLPVDLEAMKDISGVGQSRLEKYGSRFIDVIKEYLAVEV